MAQRTGSHRSGTGRAFAGRLRVRASGLAWLLLAAFPILGTSCGDACDPDANPAAPVIPIAPPTPPTPPTDDTKEAPWILIKADDMAHDLRDPSALHPRWHAFFALQAELEIPVAVGVEGWSLESGKEGYFDELRRRVESGWVELYNHGYTHSLAGADPAWNATTEFRGTPCWFQRDHLSRTQGLLAKTIGVTSIAFGAPGNAGDDSTVCAMRTSPEIRIWFAGRAGAGTINLPLSPCESPLPHPNFEVFRAAYDPQARTIVLQIHPASWQDKKDSEEFRRIVEFLKSEGACFATLAQVAVRPEPVPPTPPDSPETPGGRPPTGEDVTIGP